MKDNKKNDDFTLADNLALSAWNRLRNLALATERYENFVQLGSSNLPENGKSVKWEPKQDDEDSAKLALGFLLMNLEESFTKENSLLLLKFSEEGVTPSELSASTGKAELEVRERLGQMSQTGLVVKNIESGKYLLSDSGIEIVEMINDAVEKLKAKIDDELPEILGKKQENAK